MGLVRAGGTESNYFPDIWPRIIKSHRAAEAYAISAFAAAAVSAVIAVFLLVDSIWHDGLQYLFPDSILHAAVCIWWFTIPVVALTGAFVPRNLNRQRHIADCAYMILAAGLLIILFVAWRDKYLR
jgi:hypothetical protein